MAEMPKGLMNPLVAYSSELYQLDKFVDYTYCHGNTSINVIVSTSPILLAPTRPDIRYLPQVRVLSVTTEGWATPRASARASE